MHRRTFPQSAAVADGYAMTAHATGVLLEVGSQHATQASTVTRDRSTPFPYVCEERGYPHTVGKRSGRDLTRGADQASITVVERWPDRLMGYKQTSVVKSTSSPQSSNTVLLPLLRSGVHAPSRLLEARNE